MAATQTTNNNSIRSILEKEKLNGINFLEWYRNLRIVLRNEQKLHHLEEALPKAPPATATADVRNAYTRRVNEQQEVACLMLQQAEQELFEIVKAFHACKQEDGQSISTYVLKMKAYLDQMERLGYPMPLKLIGYINGTSISPSPKVTIEGKANPNPDLLTWTEDDQRAVILLQSSLTEEAAVEVLGLTTAYQIWLSLEAAYSNASVEQ
ncbi:hypothetical protein Tco_0023018, partial [Tanacetum coccineum]